MNHTRDTNPPPQKQPPSRSLGQRWASVPPGPDAFDVVLRERFAGPGLTYAQGEAEFVGLVRAALGEPVVGRSLHVRHGCEEPGWDACAALFEVEPREVLVNWNVGLGYHRDVTAPYPSTNAMVTFRYACRGGLTVFPDRRLAVEPQDGWVLLFDGAAEVHGVTPLLTGDGGWRASVVFYVPREE